MNVRELLEKLSSVTPGATVLLLPAHRDATGAEILRTVIVPRLLWMHERQHRNHGAVDDFFHSGVAPSANFDETTDNAILERVVLLIAERDNFDLFEEPAPKGLLSMARVREKAAQHRRQMLANGELLSEADFRATLGVSKKRLAALLADGRVFALDVDGEAAFPALLCNKALRLSRLWRIARIIAPAPPVLRLDFFTEQSAALGGRVPVHMLEDDSGYRKLRAFAGAWASEFSRTSVVVWDGNALDNLTLAKPLYICTAEIDPRRVLWRRALSAVRSTGYTHPHEIPSARPVLVIVVERTTAGQQKAEPEAGYVCYVDGRTLRVTVHAKNGDAVAQELKLATKHPTVVDVADALFSLLAKLS